MSNFANYYTRIVLTVSENVLKIMTGLVELLKLQTNEIGDNF